MALRFEDGWASLENMWIGPLFRNCSGPLPLEHRFTSSEMVSAYTICYRLCTQRNPNNYSPKLYKHYVSSLEDFVVQHVAAGFMESSTDDRALLRELAARWAQYQSMLRDFPRPFHYLERYYIRATRVATLEQAGEAAFRQGAVLPFKALIAQALLRMGEEAARGDEGAAAVAGMAFRALSQVDPEGAEEVEQEWETRGVDMEQARAWGLGCVDAEPKDRVLRNVLPQAPSQGSFFLRYNLHKLRVLVLPAVQPRRAAAAAPSEEGPPAKLSRTGPAASVVSPAAARATLAPRDAGITSKVLREVTYSLKDDLFRELIDSLYLPA